MQLQQLRYNCPNTEALNMYIFKQTGTILMLIAFFFLLLGGS